MQNPKPGPDANIQVTAGHSTKSAVTKPNDREKDFRNVEVVLSVLLDLITEAIKADSEATEATILLNGIETTVGETALVRVKSILSDRRGLVVEYSVEKGPEKSDRITGLVVRPGNSGWDPLST